MRIRKRSVGLLSSSAAPSGKSEAFTGYGDEEEQLKKKEKEKEEFLLPLVAAVMDVQAKAEAEAEISALSTPQPPLMEISGISEIGVRKRRAHNWRDALLRLGADSEEEIKEGDKSDYRWDMIMSKNPEDKFKRAEHKESGFFEKSSTRTRTQDLVVEKKRASVNGGRNVDSNETVFKNSKANIKIKNENHHGGSQCKRRNGRGWRCSQWTLVGYSLCEHHLGKSRFKHINSSDGPVTANNKGSKFKELHLVHAASPKVELP